MAGLFNLDWGQIFTPTTPLLETFLRGSITYLALFALLRLVLKRETGTLGITNLLVVVLLADAVQNGMAGEYHSITDGILLVSVILFWSYALDWLGYRFPRLQYLVHPPPLLLVKDGQMLRHNMRKELITKEELLELLREQGIDDVNAVKTAYMEGTGRISVVTYESEKLPRARNERPAV
ncbi:MAG: DUF421 domain-containing protein [Chloroflexi bacterium]|nr:DUF421 domain-containing protein [Chloroflexota bacterium]